MDTTTCDLFSTTYHQARERFRRACPSPTVALPIVSVNYTTDICLLPGRAEGMVIHMSGTHGVEGYAGSAIQLAYLAQKQRETELPSVILVHAVNPHGMENFRRTNENNVDLNRNGLQERGWRILAQALDSSTSSSSVSEEDLSFFNLIRNQKDQREKMALFFRPLVLWGSYMLSSMLSWCTSILALLRHGQPRLKRAMVLGQYHNATDVFYGGDRLQASLVALGTWMDEHVTVKKEWDSEVLTIVDVHTGLGKKGEDTILYGDIDNAKSVVCQWFPGSECKSEQAGSVSAGYEGVQGFVMGWLLARLLGQPVESNLSPHLAIAQEFGTLPSVLVGNSLVLENAGRQVGLEWGNRTTRRTFYPADAEWRAKVLENGLRLLDQAIERSRVLSLERKAAQAG